MSEPRSSGCSSAERNRFLELHRWWTCCPADSSQALSDAPEKERASISQETNGPNTSEYFRKSLKDETTLQRDEHTRDFDLLACWMPSQQKNFEIFKNDFLWLTGCREWNKELERQGHTAARWAHQRFPF